MKKLILFIFLIPFFINTKMCASGELCENAKSAILIDSKTNKVLYEKDSNIKLPMASMTKVMTLAIIYDEIKAGNIRYEDTIETSEYAKSMGGSQVYLEVGEKHKLSELIKCICIASANDASVAVAERISGNEKTFVSRMNEKAKSLGMMNTNYLDCTGLTDNDHYTSAYDMAIISSYLINKHPEVLAFTSQKEAYFRENTENPFWLVNTNKLVGRHEGVDGLKTGVLM